MQNRPIVTDAHAKQAQGEITLAYGREEWTTAVHLHTALARLSKVQAIGPGHTGVASTGRPPLVWVESGIPWMPEVRDLVGRRTAAWLIDTHRGWHWRASAAAAFGTAYVAQLNGVDQFRSVGVDTHWLPLAAPAELCAPGPDLDQRQYDVALVGQIHRGDLRDQVLRALDGVCLIAPTGYRTPEAMMSLYRSSRVVINVPLAQDLNMRAFEALGSRALLITGEMRGSVEVLGDLPTVVRSTNPAEWTTAVTSVLSSLDQARADRGHERVLGAHTYDHRARQVMDTLEQVAPENREEAELARCTAAAWARWGDPMKTWQLARSPRLAGRAALMRTLIDIKKSTPYRRYRALR